MPPQRHPHRGQGAPPQGPARHFFSVAVEQRDVDVSMLDEQQRAVFDKVIAGENLFITGAGGSGKSFLLSVIIDGLKQKFGHAFMVAVTASTGMASSRIGGTTIHSWAGLSGTEKTLKDALKRIRSSAKAPLRWVETKALVSDEVSMLGADQFDLLEAIARDIRGNDLPFGGMQVIWTGDFLQLPPVTESGESSKYAFQAKSWGAVFKAFISLRSIYRQSEQEFISALNRCRVANLDDQTVALLSSLSRPISADVLPSHDPIYLFSTRKEVEHFNKQRLALITSPIVAFKSCDWSVDKKTDLFFKTLPVDATLHLKTGAQVMLVRNLDEGLTNGTIGIVKGFYTYAEATGDEIYRKKIGFVRQIPVSDEGIPVSYSAHETDSPLAKRVPLVEFKLNGSFEHVLILPVEFQVDFDGKPVVKRIQIPLILAWAVTVHKSQGHSFDKMVVDLSRVFAKGQAYVALSRASTLSGLQVINFSPSKVLANPVALSWYKDTFPDA